MKVRQLLILTALVSSILGAVVVYLFLTVPNDLKADALLKEARGHIAARRSEQAHDTLVRVIQQYPRTDAAAAATVALVKLEEQQRAQIQAEIVKLREEQAGQAKAIGEIQKNVGMIGEVSSKAAADAAAVKAAQAQKPAAVTTKKAPARKTPTKKAPTRRKKR